MPVVEKPSDDDAGTFHGLLGLAESLPPSSSLKVLWTHGMCTHPSSWVDDRMKRLVASIGGTSQTVGVRPVGSHGASLRTDRVALAVDETIDVTFLTWSALTAPYKAALTYDHSKQHGGDFPYGRATLNRELKRGLINDCMTDVVVYGGPNGVNIRHAAQEAVCESIGGRVEGTTCNVPPGGSPAALAFVTESLGSKMLFDAIMEVWTLAEKSDDKTAVDRVATSLAATRMMYMVANQLPLLDAAGTETAGALWDAVSATAGDAQQHPECLRPLLARSPDGRPHDRADDPGRLLRSERSPELPDRSRPSRRQPTARRWTV